MNYISVARFAYTPMGVFSRISVGEFQCYALEDPWKNNETGVSCIPIGVYDVKLGRYNKGGYPAYEIQDVPNRTNIKIHRGNTHENVEGCLVLGENLGYINGNWAVINSKSAFKAFMREAAKIKPEQIFIENYVGGILDD